MSEEDKEDTAPSVDPLTGIRAILPRSFDREDVQRATKRAKSKDPRITWAEAKRRAMAWLKAMSGAPAYDNTVLFAPPIRKGKKPARRVPNLWWTVTMKVTKERKVARMAREAILKKVGANQADGKE